ncbi:MAG: transposase [Flavobacteriales bacterium Tduv]
MICIRFCGFRLEDQIPNYTTLCRFSNEIIAKKAYELLLKKINKELGKHQAIVKIGVIVDASITVSPFFPREPYLRSEGSEGRGEKQFSQRKTRSKKETQSEVDNQGK